MGCSKLWQTLSQWASLEVKCIYAVFAVLALSHRIHSDVWVLDGCMVAGAFRIWIPSLVGRLMEAFMRKIHHVGIGIFWSYLCTSVVSTWTWQRNGGSLLSVAFWYIWMLWVVCRAGLQNVACCWWTLTPVWGICPLIPVFGTIYAALTFREAYMVIQALSLLPVAQRAAGVPARSSDAWRALRCCANKFIMYGLGQGVVDLKSLNHGFRKLFFPRIVWHKLTRVKDRRFTSLIKAMVILRFLPARCEAIPLKKNQLALGSRNLHDRLR